MENKENEKKNKKENTGISLYALKEFVKRDLENEKINEAEEKAYIFVMDFFNIETKKDFIIKKHEDISEFLKKDGKKFFEALEKIKKMPIEYVTNKKYIYDSLFYVKEGVLIPRNDTEIIIDVSVKDIKQNILNQLDELEKNEEKENVEFKTKENKENKENVNNEKNINLNILDLCAGSGAIGISVLKEILKFLNGKDIKKRLENLNILYEDLNINFCFIDISDIALDVLNINIKNILLNNKEFEKFNLINKIIVLKSDLFEELNKALEKYKEINGKNVMPDYKFQYVLSNPPYIKTKDVELLSSDVKCEPHLALDGGKDGLDYYKKILITGKEFFKKGSKIFFEIGYNQAEDISEIIKDINEENALNFNLKRVIKDIEGRDRTLEIEYN